MKKFLIASTALVATTTVAAADVSFGGFGRFGLFHQENATGVNETRLEQRFRLTITGSTETDGGVKFEGRIRFQTDENGDGNSNVAQRSAAGFAVSSGGLRVDVGHVSDVVDSGDVVNYYGYGVGLTSFAEQSSGHGLPASGFGVGGDDALVSPTVKVRYAMNDFTVSASFSQDSTSDPRVAGSEEIQIGFGYNFGNYSAGILFGNRETNALAAIAAVAATPGDAGQAAFAAVAATDVDFWAASFSGDLGAFGFSVLLTDTDAVGRDLGVGVSAKYDISAATQLRAVYSDGGTAADDTYGIGVRHDLGGGVTLAGGIGEVAGATTADLGVQFNF